jgi:pyridoxamine 5'-phosphate oxidase|tara:strand:- start:59744 stop:60385 length:642 start_codon:yes stop_codon:yes gene_type:complete
MSKFLDDLKHDHSDFDDGKLESHYGDEPWDLFVKWYAEAFEREQVANAMTISTASAEGQPTTRIVYLKELLDEKFIFYTNYNSEKGRSLIINNKTCLHFFWPQAQRQIRIDGIATKVSPEMSDEYFASRPRESQLGAWASQQSEILESREELENRIIELDAKYPNDVPRPPHWGGYEVVASKIEFWQGRPSRLHDRIVYQKEDGNWKIFRLNP